MITCLINLKLSKQLTYSQVYRNMSKENKRRYKELRRIEKQIKIDESLKKPQKFANPKKPHISYPYPLTIEKGQKKDTSIPMPPSYCSNFVEPHWYAWWEAKKMFESDKKKLSSKVFSLVIPPPNITGKLHMGHALTTTIEDILARWLVIGQHLCDDKLFLW